MINPKVSLGDWYPLLIDEFNKQYMTNLGYRIAQDSWRGLCPREDKIFRAYKLCPPADTKVVILGQDPYPSAHADGFVKLR